MADIDQVLAALTAVLEQRKQNAAPDSSYVAKLHRDGLDKILKKVGEECAETLIAAWADFNKSNPPSDPKQFETGWMKARADALTKAGMNPGY